MTTLLIARHGNTFEKDQVPLRIGCKTDLPLSSSGITQAISLGNYINSNNIQISEVYCSTLKRTKETAAIALDAAKISLKPKALSIFDEIDYGPDEGKTNEEVISRIGEITLRDWEDLAIAPPGWVVDTNKIIKNWLDFANNIINLDPHANNNILVITSNGIARFAPYLTGDFFEFTQNHKIKLATGGIGSFTYKNGVWQTDYWNQIPRIN